MERFEIDVMTLVRLSPEESARWLIDSTEVAAWRRGIKRALRRDGAMPARIASYDGDLLEEVPPVGVERQERMWAVTLDVGGDEVRSDVEATAAQFAASRARHQVRRDFQEAQRRGLVDAHLDVPDVRVVSVSPVAKKFLTCTVGCATINS